MERQQRAPNGKALQHWRSFVDVGDSKNCLRFAHRQVYPLADTTLELIALKLPSPLEAQLSRAALLYPLAESTDDGDDHGDEDAKLVGDDNDRHATAEQCEQKSVLLFSNRTTHCLLSATQRYVAI